MDTKKRQQYTHEFKVAAVQRMRSREKSTAALARELGLAVNQLYRWNAVLTAQPDARGSDVFPGHGQQSAVDTELARLRRENAVLREERDILKKATFFKTRLSVIKVSVSISYRHYQNARPYDIFHSSLRYFHS